MVGKEGDNGSNGDKPKRNLSPEHLEALARGRKQGKIVNDYLRAFDAKKPRRGRPVTPEHTRERLEKVEAELEEDSTSASRRLTLIQEKMDLEVRLTSFVAKDDIGDLEAEFIKVAREYGESKGLTRAAWREFGLPPKVLDAAGIK